MRLIPLVALLIATPVHADDTTHALTVVNDTTAAVNQLFVAGGKSGKLRAKVAGIFGTADEYRDRLDAKMLPRGGTLVVTLKGDRCRYDIRAVLEDGRTYVGDDIDVCTASRWAISQGTPR